MSRQEAQIVERSTHSIERGTHSVERGTGSADRGTDSVVVTAFPSVTLVAWFKPRSQPAWYLFCKCCICTLYK